MHHLLFVHNWFAIIFIILCCVNERNVSMKQLLYIHQIKHDEHWNDYFFTVIYHTLILQRVRGREHTQGWGERVWRTSVLGERAWRTSSAADKHILFHGNIPSQPSTRCSLSRIKELCRFNGYKLIS